MKARKTLTMAAALTVAILTMSGCTSQDAPQKAPTVATSFAAGTTMAKLQSAGAMTVGTRFHQPLFSDVGKGKVPAGFDADIATLIASKLGIPKTKITWVESTSATRNALVTDGKADLIVAGDSIDDASKDKVAFAGPYFYAGQDLLVAAGNPDGIHGPEDLRKKTVCAAAKSTASRVIARYGVTVVTASSTAKCLDLLTQKKAVAVTGDVVTLAAIVAANTKKVEVLGNPFTSAPRGIVLAVDDDEFRSFVNDVLEQAFDDGTWNKLWAATAGTVLGPSHPPILDRY
jgi:glutamate transport system substrate-binding protein